MGFGTRAGAAGFGLLNQSQIGRLRQNLRKIRAQIPKAPIQKYKKWIHGLFFVIQRNELLVGVYQSIKEKPKRFFFKSLKLELKPFFKNL